MGMSLVWKCPPGNPTMTLQTSIVDLLRSTSSWAFRGPDGLVFSPGTGHRLGFEVSADPKKGTVLAVVWPEADERP